MRERETCDEFLCLIYTMGVLIYNKLHNYNEEWFPDLHKYRQLTIANQCPHLQYLHTFYLECTKRVKENLN